MSITQKIITLSNRLTSGARKKLFRNYVQLNFEDKHIRHLKSLKDRSELLSLMPKHGIAAEIGVNEGDFSEKILSICIPEKLILIDLWGSKRYHSGLFEKVKKRFARQISDGQVRIIRDLSFDGIASCEDSFFDWVYLDTDHSYHVTIKELELLRPKIKPGGIISGHDYIVGNWNDGVRYGVIEAVREFCLKYDWEMIYLTHELDNHPSFAIREIA